LDNENKKEDVDEEKIEPEPIKKTQSSMRKIVRRNVGGTQSRWFK
jgi:hypothetical protein